MAILLQDEQGFKAHAADGFRSVADYRRIQAAMDAATFEEQLSHQIESNQRAIEANRRLLGKVTK